MDDNDVHPEAVQQIEVVDNAEKRVVGDNLAAEGDHESLAAERMDIRRGEPDPLDERARGRRVSGRRGVGQGRHRVASEGIDEPADYNAAPYNSCLIRGAKPRS